MKFRTLDPVWSQAVDDEAKNFIKTMLFCQYEWYKKGPRGGKTMEGTKKFYNKKGIFLTGFKRKIINQLRNNDKIGGANHVVWENEDQGLYQDIYCAPYPSVPGIKFREDQERVIDDAIINIRGVIKAPARTGKTVVAAGLISIVPKSHVLFICHTKDLLWQTVEEFKRFRLPNIGIVGDGYKEWNKTIVVALHQSMVNIPKKDYCDYYDMIIIDEVHHVRKLDGNYAKILMSCLAPYRIGLTATLPKKQIDAMTVEGLVGPMIGEVTMDEAQALGILSEPKVRVIQVPSSTIIKNLKTFWEAYLLGVVRNRARNRLIMKTAQQYLEQDMTVLIIVSRIQHGMILEEIFAKLLPEFKTPFLCGGIGEEASKNIKRLEKKIEETRSEYLKLEWQRALEELRNLKKKVQERSKRRNEYRHLINERKVRCIIVTNIWNEGINIPTLNVVINAAGGKSEIATVQAASRSLTGHKDKEEGIIVDFFDQNSRYFVDHFGHRFALYCEMGWV